MTIIIIGLGAIAVLFAIILVVAPQPVNDDGTTDWSFDWRHEHNPDTQVRRVQIARARQALIDEGVDTPSYAAIMDRYYTDTGRTFE